VKAHKQNLLAVAIALSLTAPAIAQNDSPALEEVMVTAQKRPQSLRDVPLSVNALSGEKIESAGITNIETLRDYIPSFNMTQTGIGTNIAIRGISSGVNQGFEQSAAQFIDGIHYGRAQLSRAPFLDIKRVEVLRGPQSILFGKNSTAGAISITTAKPGDELEGKLSALYEPEHGEQDVRLILSGPISDTVGGRLAILQSSLDGYMENTTLKRDESGDKNRVIRATLQWQPSDLWDIVLKAEDGSFDSNGRNIEAVKAVDNPMPVYDKKGNLVPTVSYKNVLATLTPDTYKTEPSSRYQLDTTHDWKRQSNGDYSYNDTENVTLTVERELGEHTLTSVTGYNAYTYEELCDCDFTGSPGFNILSNEDYSQVSQELRIASPEDETFSYLGGVFFQGSSLKFHDVIGVPKDSFIAAALSAALRGASTERNFEQDSDLYAVFGQGTWNVTDLSRLILGARYTQETKEANREQFHVAPSGTVLPLGTPNDPYNRLWGVFKVEPYDTINGDRDESSLTPQITFQHDLNGTDMLYASYTTGFKSGGFDVRANAHPDPTINNAFNITSDASTTPPTVTVRPIEGTFEFEEEEVTNYEIGGKFVLAEGAAELNIALFRSEFTNMQTSQFDGGVSFNVTNAGEATVQGLEVDGRWAAADSILLRGGFAFIDFEYTDFKNSQCYFGQEDPDDDNICDATGKRREFTPELQGNAGIDHTVEFSNGLKLVSTLDVIYSADYLTTPSLDPKFKQDAYTKINARIALSGDDDMWELALIGKNLTDESVVTYANGLPVATTLTADTSSGYYAFYERPRNIAIQGTIRF